MLRRLAVSAFLAFGTAACTGSSATTDGGPGGQRDAGPVDAGPYDAGNLGMHHLDGGPTDAGSPPTDGGAVVAAGTALVRVHYPAGTHSVTIRGAAGGLNWTTGVAPTASGTTYSYLLTGVTAPVEWKPLLDDTTWALGPNYHAIPGEAVDIWPHFTSTNGVVQTLLDGGFQSTILNDNRPIYVYLPASYFENTVATYPVVYMHDGQNLWAALPDIAFAATWNVDTAFDAASNTGTCSSGGVVGWGAQPLGGTPTTCNGDGDCDSGSCRTFPEAIVVGVGNNENRVLDYTPPVDPSESDAGLGPEGGADLYLQALVEEVKPLIDGMFRTRPELGSTSMSGSSLGGLVTAYAGLKYPNVYSRVAEISPSSWWDFDVIVSDVNGTLPAPNRPLFVYVDSGQGDVDDEADTDLLAAAYADAGYTEGVNLRHVIQPGAVHSEVYWAERFPGAMQFILGTR